MSQTILSKPGPGIIAEHLDPQCRARIQRDAAERSAAPALGNLRVRVRRVRPSLPLSGEVCPLSGTCLPDLCSAPSRFWGQALGVQAQRASNGGVGCQGKKRQHRPHPCLAQQQGRNVLERQLGPPLCGGLDLLRGQGRGSNTQRGAPRRHQPTPLVEATLLRRLPPSCRVRAVPEDFLETPGSDAQDAQSTCTALNRTGSSSVGVASLGPLAILREDYAAWQAWYEEQQDFPARLLRVLNDGGSAVAGLAVSWGQPERAAQERQQLARAGTTLAALLFFGSSEEKMEREIQFYRDGTVLLVYQLQQDLPLLGGALAHATGAAAQPVDARRLARLRRNLVSLLPFLFIVVNTFPATPVVLTTLLRFVPRHLIIPAAYDEERLQAYQRLRAIRVRQASRSGLLLPPATDRAASETLAPFRASAPLPGALAPVAPKFWWEVAPSPALAPAQQAVLVGARLLVWQWGVGLGWGWGYGIGWSFNPETADWEVSLGWGLGWGWGWGWWL